MVVDGTTIKYDSDGAGTWVSLSGTYTKPTDAVLIRFREALQALFWTTDAGPKRLATLTGTVRDAGLPKALDLQVAVVPAGTVLPNGEQLNYRVSYARIDENGQEIPGADSEPLTVINTTGATDDYDVTTTIPDGIIAGDFLDLWRTLHITNPGPAGDTYFRVLRHEVTSGEITAGTITISDTTDDAFLDFAVQLVTNPEVEGPEQEDSRPPLARDMSRFKSRMWYVHGRREHFLEFQFLDVAGITDAVDTVVLTDGVTTRTYTFDTAEVIATQTFQRFTGGTLAQNVRDTMQSFVRVVNRDTGNSLFYAYYISGTEDQPGKVRIRRRDFTDVAISITQPSGGAGGNFQPSLPTSGTSFSTLAEADFANRISYSKFEQPDSVPRTNYFDVDTQRNAVVRILTIKDSLIIFTERSIWRISGDTDQDFQLRQLDPSTRILAPESAVVLNNAVYAYTNQGVVRVQENGVAIVGRQIEFALRKIRGFTDFDTLTFGIPYEEERQYWLFTQTDSTDTYPTRAWVHNFLTESWVQRIKPVSHGWVRKEGQRLIWSHAVDPRVLIERKSFDETNQSDYSDEEISVTITGVSTGPDVDDPTETVTVLTVTYTYTTVPFTDGFYIEQAATSAAGRALQVTSLGGTSYEVTLDRLDSRFSAAAATVFLNIPSEVAWAPVSIGDTSMQKQFSRAQIYFDADRGIRHYMGFASDLLPGEEFLSKVIRTSSFGFGLSPWGPSPWGDGAPSSSSIVRSAVPVKFQRARALTVLYRHSLGNASFIINQMAVQTRVVSERTVRTPR